IDMPLRASPGEDTCSPRGMVEIVRLEWQRRVIVIHARPAILPTKREARSGRRTVGARASFGAALELSEVVQVRDLPISGAKAAIDRCRPGDSLDRRFHVTRL